GPRSCRSLTFRPESPPNLRRFRPKIDIKRRDRGCPIAYRGTVMVKLNGIHHLAICTADIKAQIEFFTDVLGMELVALYWMHGVVGAWHGFLKLNDQSSIAFVQTPAIANIPAEIGKTHAGSPGGASSPGTTQHIAFNVDTEAELLTMRDRIRSRD